MKFKLDIKFFKSNKKFSNDFKNVSHNLINVSTDSRSISKGDFFLALKGDVFDGHDFIERALNSGASGIIVNESFSLENFSLEGVCVIKTTDTLHYMQELAIEKLQEWKKKGGIVICLTGSNGKTTNKEILFSIMNEFKKGLVHYTRGNLNNHIGVPLTIFEIKDFHKFAIIEIGTNHPGEIKRLCEIAQPDFGYITNIGDSHLEFLGSREGVFKEKGALFEYVMDHSSFNNCFLKNGYDPILAQLNDSEKVISVGKVQEFRIDIDDEIIIYNGTANYKIKNVNILEKYNQLNLALCSIFVANIFNIPLGEIISVACAVKLPENNRSMWIAHKNKKIFLDAYNANPSSMEASLDSFHSFLEKNEINKNNVLFILGDMNELGENAQVLHRRIGNLLKKYQVPNVAFIGRYRNFYLEGYDRKDCGSETLESFSSLWKNLFENHQYFFIKGSRSLKLENLVKDL